MARTNRVVCPNCGKGLKSTNGVGAGQTIPCPHCATLFTIRGEESGASPSPGPVGNPVGKVNSGRLAVVMVGALLYLLGGAALALYCFTLNVHKPEESRPVEQAHYEEDGDEPTAVPPAPAAVNVEEQRKIDDAIAKGVWYLKDHTLPAGTWGDTLPDGSSPVAVGFASLPALTLLECGVPATDPVVRKAAVYVRAQVEKLGNVHQNYQRSLAILFLDRLGDPKDEGLIQHLALCLMTAQHPDEGGWSYNGPMLDRTKIPEFLRALKYEKQSLGEWRKQALNGGTFDPGGWDNSNTQFAILGLWTAQRHGVAIERSMALVEKHFRATQLSSAPDPTGDNLNLDGSWYYNATINSGRWPSMTCAGLLGLAVAHAVTTDVREKKQKPLDDPAIKRALGMLEREIDRPGEKRPPDLYFLWSLERVGVLYNLRKIGDKDWYAWGSKVLLPRQWTDGSWMNGSYYGSTPVLDTCFALLFLKQANLAKDLSSKLQLLQTK